MSDMKDKLKDRIRRASAPYDQLIDPNPNVNTDSQEYGNTGPQKTIKKATFDMDSGLHTRLKVYAANRGKPMVDVVEEALRRYLAEQE